MPYLHSLASLNFSYPFPAPLSARTYVTFDPILQTHMTLQNAKTFSGGFEFECEFSLAGTPSNYELMVFGLYLVRVISDTSIVVFPSTSGGGATFTVPSMGGNLHTLKIAGSMGSGLTTLTLDGAAQTKTAASTPDFTGSFALGRRGGSYFNGVIANVKLTDLVNTSNSEFWAINTPVGTNTEQSTSGNNLLTYVNAGASTREVFTKVGDDWLSQTERWSATPTLGPTWSALGGGVYSCNGTQAVSNLTGGALVNGYRYQFVVNMTARTQGSVVIINGTALSIGQNSQIITPTISSAVISAQSSAIATVQDISVKRILEVA